MFSWSQPRAIRLADESIVTFLLTSKRYIFTHSISFSETLEKLQPFFKINQINGEVSSTIKKIILLDEEILFILDKIIEFVKQISKINAVKSRVIEKICKEINFYFILGLTKYF